MYFESNTEISSGYPNHIMSALHLSYHLSKMLL